MTNAVLMECFLTGNSLIQHLDVSDLKKLYLPNKRRRTGFPELSAAQFPYFVLRYYL